MRKEKLGFDFKGERYMENQKIVEIADLLRNAEKQKKTLEPLTQTYPEISIPDAYKIQLKNVENRVKNGERLIGKKVGLTSKAMQKMLAVEEPDYGHLFANMVFPEEETIDLGRFLQPKIEAELGFLLKKDISGPDCGILEVVKSTEAIVPVFEIIDSRIGDWKIKIEDTIADNGSSAGVIIGSFLGEPSFFNLQNIGLVLRKNGLIIDTATGAAVMGNPAYAIAWLANKLSEFQLNLKAGEIILAGSFTGALNIEEGDYFEASFDGLGQVRARF